MQEIILKTDQGEKKIEIKLKGKHTKKIWEHLREVASGEPDKLIAYLDYIDQIESEMTGLTIEQLNELDIDEKTKLTQMIVDKAQNILGFSMSSLKQGI